MHLKMYVLSLYIYILSDCYHECRQPEHFSNIFALFFYPVSSRPPNNSVEHRVIIISGSLMFSVCSYTGSHIYTAFPAPRKAFFFQNHVQLVSLISYTVLFFCETLQGWLTSGLSRVKNQGSKSLSMSLSAFQIGLTEIEGPTLNVSGTRS